jgi:hypothetical protein
MVWKNAERSEEKCSRFRVEKGRGDGFTFAAGAGTHTHTNRTNTRRRRAIIPEICDP